jgi:hypothetical protein
MTIFLKAVFGPFKRTVDKGYTPKTTEVIWSFIVIDEADGVRSSTLKFSVERRKFFTTSHSKTSDSLPENVDMFVPDKPMMYGKTITDILKSKLTEDDVALVTKLAMKAR